MTPVVLTQERVYTLTIGGAVYAGMREESRWECCRKLSNGTSVAIVADAQGPMSRALDDAFDRPTSGLVIVAGTADVMRAAAA